MGVITFVSYQAGRHFWLADLRWRKTWPRRAARPIDNAMLYRRPAGAGGKDRTAALLDTLLQSRQSAWRFSDADCRVLRVNETLAKMSGIPAVEHLGKTVAEVVPANWEQRADPIFSR